MKVLHRPIPTVTTTVFDLGGGDVGVEGVVSEEGTEVEGTVLVDLGDSVVSTVTEVGVGEEVDNRTLGDLLGHVVRHGVTIHETYTVVKGFEDHP